MAVMRLNGSVRASVNGNGSRNGDSTKPIDLAKYGREIERGLANEQIYLDRAAERLAFYNYEGERYERHFRRDAESTFDFYGRSHRSSGFLRMCVEVLCEHVYSPGPSRRWSDPGGEEFLEQVWMDNLVDAILLRADNLATLNNVAAIQIDAGEGDFILKPITYRLWGREQLVVWTDPNNATVPQAVATIDAYDAQKRCRLWSSTEVWTYLTKKAKIEESAEGQAWYLYSKEPHDYGTLPFSFVHYDYPVQTFETVAVGDFIWKAELSIDNRLMKSDESIERYMNPIPYAKGVPDHWKVNLQPGQFVILPPRQASPSMDGGYMPGEPAELGFAQSGIDVAGWWEDLWNYRMSALDAARVPLSAVRMEQQGVASGISLMVEQEPLLKRAAKRRKMYQVYESDLAKRTLICAGNHYGKAGLTRSAELGDLMCAWPQPRLAVNTPDKLELLQGEVSAGLISFLMAMEDWHDVGRNEALEIIEQIRVDDEEVLAIRPDLRMPTAAVKTEAEKELEGPQGEEAKLEVDEEEEVDEGGNEP
jgi:hypothetical protein